MLGFLNSLFDLNKRELKRLSVKVELVNSFEPLVKKFKDKDFLKESLKLKQKASAGNISDDDKALAFAMVREAAVRKLGMRHFDVQLMAAWALSEGSVVEQKTGEGKTLSATPALYFNALFGRGAHLVTVNDYLAQRDAGWMAEIFDYLGLSVGVIIHDQAFIYDPTFTNAQVDDKRLAHLKPVSRQQAYQADITYGTNNEFGFDYLRDNMVGRLSEKVQRGHFFAIVDEVDSILIDEARTPLIISAPADEPTEKYHQFNLIVNQLLRKRDYEVDEKRKTVSLTEHGTRKVEKVLRVDNLYEQDFEALHFLEQALKAKELFHKDKEYIVKDNKIIIVDEHTGRLMPGRRYSEGLHQAIEAKEGVPIQKRSKTMATISLQNYFRMYQKLAGMTGTAATEAEEFEKIYKLSTVVIPTNKPIIRQDLPDRVYKTTRAKFAAIIHEVESMYQKGQPVLIGTRSIEINQIISSFLKRKGIPHNVLNAKQHQKEAQIIAQAGRPGAVTVATNMAGRGVDIVLGGALPDKPEGASEAKYKKSPEYQNWLKRHNQVIKAGGLAVIGSERHESRRIDNQLRGRSGRQGDPGLSRFYVSLDDEIMRIFGGEQISKLMTMFNIPENQPLEHSLVSRSIEQAQTKVESFYFDIRKSLVDYDDVINKQRQIIYQRRDRLLKLADKSKDKLVDEVSQIADNWISRLVDYYLIASHQPDIAGLLTKYAKVIPLDANSIKQLKAKLESLSADQVRQELGRINSQVIKTKEQQYPIETVLEIARIALIKAIDDLWVDHIDTLTNLREDVSLRGFAQKDPLVEYKQEAFKMFDTLIDSIETSSLYNFFHLAPQASGESGLLDKPIQTQGPSDSALSDFLTGQPPTEMAKPATIQHRTKLGRNDPCWCGSGKKWKKCHYPQLPD